MRVEQLSQLSGASVDTIRYYQSKGLLASPRREGRVAWYGDEHLDRLARIKELQEQGFSLATISRIVRGELDAADVALVGGLAGNPLPEDAAGSEPGEATYTLSQLSEMTGVPLVLLRSVESEGFLVPRRYGSELRYTEEDVDAARSALLLLEWGIPLSSLLDLARAHHEATLATARQAVTLFAEHVREPLRSAHGGPVGADDPDADRLLEAYTEMLPAVTQLVAHHFHRTLTAVALATIDENEVPS